MNAFTKILTPNESVSVRMLRLIAAGWFVVWLGWWSAAHPVLFPSPLEVAAALRDLWSDGSIVEALIASVTTNLEALALSAVIALPLAYLSRVPSVYPLAKGLSLLRFLSPAVFFLLVNYAVQDGHTVAVLILTLGEAFFLAKTMIGVVQNIPQERLDLYRTLRMDEWRVTWYGIVRSTVPAALDAIQDNAAMGLAMIMMVERIAGGGGIGVLLLNNEKHFNFDVVYAIAGIVVGYGFVQDWAIGWLRRTLCPWAVEA